jgi:hypothetical protein
MSSRDTIIAEIRRIAAANGGRPPGMQLFRSETGLGESSWKGRHWSKWSDALEEAGFAGNEFNQPYTDEQLFIAYVAVARRLGHLPTEPEYRVAGRQDPALPGYKAFRRLGTKAEFVEKLAGHANGRPDYEDVLRLCAAYQPKERRGDSPASLSESAPDGFVYLIKSSRYYKIGRSNAVGRREREIAIQLPEPSRTAHVIRTDDPVGIEAYWHNRFAEKRKNGEWFDLSAADVAAFRRRKFM